MTQSSIKTGTRKYVKGYGYLSFAINFSNKYRTTFLDSTKLKDVWEKITTFFEQRVSIVL